MYDTFKTYDCDIRRRIFSRLIISSLSPPIFPSAYDYEEQGEKYCCYSSSRRSSDPHAFLDTSLCEPETTRM